MVKKPSAKKTAVPENPGLKQKKFLLVFVVFLLIGNILSYLVEYGFRFTGNVIGEFIDDLSSFSFQALAFLIQWGIILGILIIVYHHSSAAPVPETVKKAKLIEIKPLRKAYTDLDILYATLQKSKSLRISAIAQAFNVDKERALEWAKILEEHNLAEIKYHAFQEAELTVREDA